MSTPQSTGGQADRPTPKPLRALRSLALSRGQSFAYPKTGAEARREIRRLLAARPSSRHDRLIEAHELQQVTAPHDAAAVRPSEVTGYGSTARWARSDSREES